MSAFDPKSLLGKAESDRLEFKQKEALTKPANIAREVVGFLNAKGGEIWIGVEEKDGRAVGLQSIADMDRSLISLRDHLIETIEPQYQTDEVKLDPKDGLIHVTVKKGKSPPYAQRDGGRRFLIRVADRLREMSREEIGKEFGAESTDKDRAAEIAEKLRKDQASDAIERPQLWLRLEPTESLNLDFSAKPTQDQFRIWLTDPTATGNRRSGWKFAHGYATPTFAVHLARHGDDSYHMRTHITEEGHVTFAVDRESLRIGGIIALRLDPYALIEYPVSVFRLMAAILKRYADGHANLQVVAGLVISGILGWSLQPSPREPVRLLGEQEGFGDSVLALDPARLVFTADDFRENPDRCGLRLVHYIYREFGFGNHAIPPEFDQTQGRLLLG